MHFHTYTCILDVENPELWGYKHDKEKITIRIIEYATVL